MTTHAPLTVDEAKAKVDRLNKEMLDAHKAHRAEFIRLFGDVPMDGRMFSTPELERLGVAKMDLDQAFEDSIFEYDDAVNAAAAKPA